MSFFFATASAWRSSVFFCSFFSSSFSMSSILSKSQLNEQNTLWTLTCRVVLIKTVNMWKSLRILKILVTFFYSLFWTRRFWNQSLLSDLIHFQIVFFNFQALSSILYELSHLIFIFWIKLIFLDEWLEWLCLKNSQSSEFWQFIKCSICCDDDLTDITIDWIYKTS